MGRANLEVTGEFSFNLANDKKPVPIEAWVMMQDLEI